jgi:hypothetical protein
VPTRTVDRPRHWPDAVEARLAVDRAEALGEFPMALDLSEPDGLATLVAEIDRPGSGGRHPVIVSIAELVRFGDLPAAAAALHRLLGPDGVLIAVEPVMRPRLSSTFMTAAWGVAPSVRGFHLGRDLPAALRAADFDLDDIGRTVVSTRVSPLRNLVRVVARPSLDRTQPGGSR